MIFWWFLLLLLSLSFSSTNSSCILWHQTWLSSWLTKLFSEVANLVLFLQVEFPPVDPENFHTKAESMLLQDFFDCIQAGKVHPILEGAGNRTGKNHGKFLLLLETLHLNQSRKISSKVQKLEIIVKNCQCFDNFFCQLHLLYKNEMHFAFCIYTHTHKKSVSKSSIVSSRSSWGVSKLALWNIFLLLLCITKKNGLLENCIENVQMVKPFSIIEYF